MQRNGAILAILLFVLTLGFNQKAEAGGFLDSMFGFERQERSSRYFDSYVSGGHHGAATKSVRYGKHGAFHGFREHGAKWRRLAAHSKTARHRLALRAAPRSSQTLPAPALERPCCANAQEAINRIIKDDPTLRPGDAYMSHEGLRVYVGERKNDSQFVPVEHARHIAAALKKRLKAIGAGRSGVVDVAPAPGPQAAAGRDKPRVERLVDGPQGRLIRFVGGFSK